MSSPSFASVVRRYRLAAGLTQEELAERASLSLRTVGDIERGRIRRPYRRSAQLLGSAFGLSDAELERFVLAARPAPPGAPGAGSPARAAEAPPYDPLAAIPRQLPLNPPRLVGRSRALADMSGLLAATAGTRMAIVAISGLGGAGKTALALRYAHREAHRFPDGQLYVDLHGSASDSRPLPPGAALSGILQSLQVPAAGQPASTDAQAARYRSAVAGRRLMIVLDDARDAAQVRPLLPSAPGCAVVITSRGRLTSLAAREGAHLVSLEVLTDREAQQLLTGLLGAARVASEPDAAMAIARSCAGLPLALAIVAARARASAHLPLAALARRLADPERAWSILGGGDPACDLRVAFCAGLDLVSGDARRLLRTLAAQPGGSIAEVTAVDVSAVARAGELLDELVLASLLREESSGRLTMNGLLRLYLRGTMPGPPVVRPCHACGRRARERGLHRARMSSGMSSGASCA
jgi:transcriptional regulator with XRE-family HTH domain